MKNPLIIFFTLLLFTQSTFGQSSIVSLDYKPKLTIFTENWSPYQYTDTQGKIRGTSVEKVKKVLDAANWPYEIVVLPWARAIFQIDMVPNSLIFSMARFAERENSYHWLGLLGTVKSKLIASIKNKEIEINQLADIQKYMTILKRGEASSLYFLKQNLINDKKVIWVTSSKQALHLLNIGRGDLYPDTEVGFTSAVKNSPYKLAAFKYIYDFTELDVNLYIATSRSTHPQLVQNLTQLFNNKEN